MALREIYDLTVTKTIAQPLGVRDCFCANGKSNTKGWSSKTIYTSSTLKVNNKAYTANLCEQWAWDKYVIKGAGFGQSALINVVNTILRMCIVGMIYWVGEDTHSEMTQTITSYVFITQFFNTGFILLLSNANFYDSGIPLAMIFKGSSMDFGEIWYTDVGLSIVKTMMIAAFMPLVEFGGAWAPSWAKRKMDTGCKCCKTDSYTTKKMSIQRYAELWQGPDYFIHFKYSNVLNITFVTMLYGAAMPVLFPVAMLTFFNIYTQERLCLAYYYQQPPSLDDKLIKSTLRILKWGVVGYLAFGYWSYSNLQAFSNVTPLITTKGAVAHTGHTIFYNMKLDQSTPLLFATMFVFFLLLVESCLKKYITKLYPSYGARKIDVDEDLPNYFASLKLEHRNWLTEENKNLRENYGIDLLEKELIEKIRETKMSKQTVQGVPFYHILSNPLYATDFQYYSADIPDRAALIEDDVEGEDNDLEQSDMVNIMMNMAFMPSEVGKCLQTHSASC